MRTHFDMDGIECVVLRDAKLANPLLSWRKIKKRFVYTSGPNDSVDVITLADLNLCIRIAYDNARHETNNVIEDFNYEDIAHCSVCRKVMLPDDEAYTDFETGDALCSWHAEFHESDNMYHKVIF